ncbi:hypothetical protein [Pararhodobacter sp.]|uniref:hypothetical protein n=1 Tax=Pararhodobacter sp. TaxID=2127056 RepID=UPI002AFE2D83|nr:hypothetical protein [Pararhodobacter sp.]
MSTLVEDIYAALALHLDAVGPQNAEIYLAKVALAMAQALGDTGAALAILQECTHDLRIDARDPEQL